MSRVYGLGLTCGFKALLPISSVPGHAGSWGWSQRAWNIEITSTYLFYSYHNRTIKIFAFERERIHSLVVFVSPYIHLSPFPISPTQEEPS